MDVRKKDHYFEPQVARQELISPKSNKQDQDAGVFNGIRTSACNIVTNESNQITLNNSQQPVFSDTMQERFQGKITRTPDNNRLNPYVIPTNRKTNSQTSNSNDNLQFVTNPSTSHDSSSSRLVSEHGCSRIATASKKLEQCQIKLHLFFKEIEQNNIDNAMGLEAQIINSCEELDEKYKNLCLAKMYLGHSLVCVNSNNSRELDTVIEQMNTLKKDNIADYNSELSTIFCLDNYLVHVLLLNGNYTEAKDLACEILDYMHDLIASVDKQDQTNQRLILNLTRIYLITYCLLAVCYHKEDDREHCGFALDYIIKYTVEYFDENPEYKEIIENTANSIDQNNTDKLLKYDLINY
jgi:hypothetical protein